MRVPDFKARRPTLQPHALVGYFTMLALLAAQQRASRLRIAVA